MELSAQVSSPIAIFGGAELNSIEIKSAAESLGAARLTVWSGEALDVVITTVENLDRFSRPLVELATRIDTSPARIIVVGKTNDASARMVEVLLRSAPIFAWVESFSANEFRERALSALDEVRETRQAAESLTMYLEHNESLQRLSKELEARIEERRSELSESTWRLQQNQRRGEIMHRALNAVHISHSIPEMERQLLQILHPRNHAASDAPGIEWIRIAFNSQSGLSAGAVDTRASAIFSCPLGNSGQIYFGRNPEKPFRSDDKNFLTPVAEAVSLAVTRLRSLERMEQVKREWEETFNAIVNPVAVLDDQLRLVRGNRALLRGRSPEQLVGRPCYEAVFGRGQPCSGCLIIKDLQSGAYRANGHGFGTNRRTQFRIHQSVENDDRTFEVSSRPLAKNQIPVDSNSEPPRLVHLYRDVTTTERFEKRIVESSKMAELGTIGSSIAHQLNNPIGGMLSHIQLLLMDLESLDFPGKAELRQELKEMESGTRRCAEIVRDLLGFSRRGDEAAPNDHDLIEIVEQAIKITELQTRSHGVRFKIDLDNSQPSSWLVFGRFNLLAQAVRAVLLALLPAQLRDTQIILQIRPNAETHEFDISIQVPNARDRNGNPSESKKESLDLTVAEQILTEHQGRLVLRRNDLVQQAVLSLPQPKV